MPLKTKILVRMANEGVHYWPDSPFPELAEAHKHVFAIIVAFDEKYSRQHEFIRFREALLRELDNEFGRDIWMFGPMSCEDIAIWIIRKVREMLQEDVGVTVSVWEDEKHCGAWVKVDEGEEIPSDAGSKRNKRRKNSLVA